jgi:hypothetical protein
VPPPASGFKSLRFNYEDSRHGALKSWYPTTMHGATIQKSKILILKPRILNVLLNLNLTLKFLCHPQISKERQWKTCVGRKR